jgi:predicted  nucleic acid-binding Zn-ribbon protein
MFKCERCGSSYSAVHAAAMENCPRCQIRDRVTAPLTMTRVELGEPGIPSAQSASASQQVRLSRDPAPSHAPE